MGPLLVGAGRRRRRAGVRERAPRLLEPRTDDRGRKVFELELQRGTSELLPGDARPAAADGGPHQTIAPGATWSPEWTVDQPAATLWYHPHLLGATAILQDRSFEDDGSLDLSTRPVSPTGILGDVVLVNGTYDPYVEVRDERVRLRLVNASNARVYAVGFADERAFDLVATDGRLLEAPEPLRRVQLSPGERAEIVATFRPAPPYGRSS